MSLYNVLVAPVVTEKSTALSETGKYAFEVTGSASKTQVKEAVQKAFGVTVEQVNIMNVRGKMKRFGKRPVMQTPWKKAIVTLKSGDKIDLFGNA
ncbi:MAG: 50S ribosomal protein L23 [Chloroflexi bacterium]|nr:50S ribosomal protein L23 [Chloroflexota bacterium]